jgi:hypothetical protein
MIKFTEKTDAEKGARNSNPTHRFAVGATVLHRVGGRTDPTPFKITRQLPETGGSLQYRIKGEKDAHERVVPETALEAGKK